MNKHPEKLNAAPQASKLVRVCVGTLAVCGMLLGTAAHANGNGSGNGPERDQNQNPPRKEEPRRERDPRSFEARSEEHRRAIQEGQNNMENSRRVGRMTPDERRDLRRQINEAGMEVYSQPLRR